MLRQYGVVIKPVEEYFESRRYRKPVSSLPVRSNSNFLFPNLRCANGRGSSPEPGGISECFVEKKMKGL